MELRRQLRFDHPFLFVTPSGKAVSGGRWGDVVHNAFSRGFQLRGLEIRGRIHPTLLRKVRSAVQVNKSRRH
jgi:hypothetical protein